MLKKKTSRRGMILIEPYKQLRFGLTFLWLNLFFATAIFYIFGSYLWDVYDTLSVYFRLDKDQSEIFFGKLVKPAIIGFLVVLLFIAVTLFTSVRYTHQIYGPLVSIRRFLDEILSGQKPSTIKLRSSDQLQDLVSRLNQMSMRLDSLPNFQSSKLQILECLDALIEGKEVAEIHFNAEDPYSEIALKINELIKSTKV